MVPKLILEVVKLIGKINADGDTVVMVEQNAKLALKIRITPSYSRRPRSAAKRPSADLLQSQDYKTPIWVPELAVRQT